MQSFGHAAVAEDGTLTIKLIGIDGEVKLEKTLSPEENVGEGGGDEGGGSSAPAAAVVKTLVMVSMGLAAFLF